MPNVRCRHVRSHSIVHSTKRAPAPEPPKNRYPVASALIKRLPHAPTIIIVAIYYDKTHPTERSMKRIRSSTSSHQRDGKDTAGILKAPNT